MSGHREAGSAPTARPDAQEGSPPPDEREPARRKAAARAERGELQERLSDWLDVPLAVLALAMLGLLIIEFTVELSPLWATRVAQAQTAIWAIFAVAFAVELALAPSKIAYLRRHWLTAISVALPAVRTIRLLRVARALRGLSLVRVVTTLNRGMRAVGEVVRRGQLGYVVALTILVTATAAAGVYYFERTVPGALILTPGDALWWATTLITTMNSSLETVSLEGRIVGLLLRVFALAVSSYITATIAVALLGGAGGRAPAAEQSELRQLRLDVAHLRQMLEQRLPRADGSGSGEPPDPSGLR